jgi:hypothetical protein
MYFPSFYGSVVTKSGTLIIANLGQCNNCVYFVTHEYLGTVIHDLL